jgi:hypothetical protein
MTMAARDGGMSGITVEAVLGWLAAHPCSTAGEVAAGTGVPRRVVLRLLRAAEREGRVHRSRVSVWSHGAWQWEVQP